MTVSFRVLALDADRLQRIRERGVDAFGNDLVVSVNDADGGTPLRCCMREAAVGERVALMAHRPADVGGAYAEVGPVFVHADPCGGYAYPDAYPEGFRRRSQLFRAYDTEGRQVHNRVVDGPDAEAAVQAAFAHPEVAYLHSRNLLAGCYMFTIRRGDDGP